jgi:hypothetical protein
MRDEGGYAKKTLPVMEFDGDKIRHMTKSWHVELAMKALGWA